ncbi:MAG: MaoC/PaaZ C-terminal domain-containing protein [Gammaproteobacteria bacterium]|nr:MaoC/PaaZ C-terminal domain-containing protein [Gammaproteobacteria bacterium]
MADSTVKTIADVEFGGELPTFVPDTSIEATRRFGKYVGWGTPRFTDHEGARKEGLPGAIVPGVMSQGFLGAMIHRWAPDAEIISIDTVFRAPVQVDHPHTITGVVTDIDEDDGTVEIDITVTNEAGETRVFGTATAKLPT